MRSCFIVALALVCAGARADDPAAYQDYVAQIATLQRDGTAIAQRDGRDALIQKYRDLIEAHPGYANNIRLETQIAMLYESDFTDHGQPPDAQAAYDTYQHIIATYEPDNPYMKTVRKLAADRAAEFDADTAQHMYESIIADYPQEDALVVQSEYALAKLAEQQGDPVTAEKYFGQILVHTPSGAKMSDAEAANLAAYQENAAASMLTAAIKGADTPEERLKALKKFLENHKELETAQQELVRQFARVIEQRASGGASEDADETDTATIDALLASLKKHKPGDNTKDDRERARAREQRARDVERTRVASSEPILDAAFTGGAQGLSDEETVTGASRTPSDGVTASRGLRYVAIAAAAIAIATAAVILVQRRRRATG